MKISLDKTVAVVGLGYVGLPLVLLAEDKGYRVIGLDIDEQKIALLKQHKAPFDDHEMAKRLDKSMTEFTSDFGRIKEASIIVICVPTPVHKDRMPNLGPVISATENILPHLQKGQLVVLESTVNPGVTEDVVIPILERSGLVSGVDFYVAHCPERINPGDPVWGVHNIPRVVGGHEAQAMEKAVAFYRSIVDAEILPMGSLKEAEAVKIVENSFRDINIAFVNELAMSFSHLGIDVMKVIKGANTKPFAFLAHYPGCGVGGHCIPVDPHYLIQYARLNGFEHDFLSLARRINSQMPKFTVDLVMKSLNDKQISISGSKIAVLGVAYKPDMGDYRESPSFEVIKLLQESGAEVVVYDPYVPSHSNVASLEEALDNSATVVVTTGHTVFKELSPERLFSKGVRTVIDGRNCLSKDKFINAGISYKGIGV